MLGSLHFQMWQLRWRGRPVPLSGSEPPSKYVPILEEVVPRRGDTLPAKARVAPTPDSHS